MAVEIIVTAYNQTETLRLTLEALARQTRLPEGVWVADDGSGPEVLAMLRRAASGLPFALHHVWQPDIGFRAARGRNNAIAASRAAILAFLDQDVLPPSGWLEAMLDRLPADGVELGETVDLASDEAATLTVESIRRGFLDRRRDAARGRELLQRERRSRCYAGLRRFGIGIKSKPRLKSANFAIFREALLAVNGFDETYEGWGQEDDDLGRRLYRAGVRPVVAYAATLALHVPHPPRHAVDWHQGANTARFQSAPRLTRCAAGLDAHPHPDVVMTAL